jgi:chitin synthase
MPQSQSQMDAKYHPSNSLGHRRTLIRPERHQPTTPLLAGKTQENKTCWVIFSRIITFWAHSAILSSIGGLQDKQSRQAWREKIALCFIALVMGAITAFLTVDLSEVLCSELDSDIYLRFNERPGKFTLCPNKYPKFRGINFLS